MRVYHAVGDFMSGNRPTMSMYPKGDTDYVYARRDGSRKIHHSIYPACATPTVMKRYLDILRLLPPTCGKPGIVGIGLFVGRKVRQFRLISEYTVSRLSGRALQRMYYAIDYHNVHPRVYASVPSENAIVDPRVCGNEARYVKHSCSPNVQLVEIDVRGKTIVFLIALQPLKEGEEVLID